MDREHAQQDMARLAAVWIAAELRDDTAFLEQTIAADFVISPTWLTNLDGAS